MQPTPEETQAIHENLHIGKKIAAIKLYRNATGLGLKESKEFIDRLDAELRAQDPDAFTVTPISFGPSTVLLFIFAIALGTLVWGILTLVG